MNASSTGVPFNTLTIILPTSSRACEDPTNVGEVKYLSDCSTATLAAKALTPSCVVPLALAKYAWYSSEFWASNETGI